MRLFFFHLNIFLESSKINSTGMSVNVYTIFSIVLFILLQTYKHLQFFALNIDTTYILE